MKTKTILHWTYLLLVSVTCCFCNQAYSQSETHNFTTYDTLINAPYAGITWRLRISRPVNMFTPNNPDTASRPAIITIPGQGEMGTNFATLETYGPHYWLKNGWDGSVMLGNGKHYPILITMNSSNTYMSGKEGSDLLDIVLSIYHIKKNSVNVAGLSQGAFCLSSSLLYENTPGDEQGMKKITSLVCLEGASTEVTAGNFDPNANAKWAKWATKYHGRFFGLEGINDLRTVSRVSEPMNAAVPGSGYFAYQNIGGGTHCCWNSMYNPAVTNWTCVGTLAPNIVTGTEPNTMGDYYSPSNIFQWMLRQGDTTLVGSADIPPIVSAGSNITVLYPANSTPLSGSATDPDGTITNYTWNKISGPAQYALSNPNMPAPMLSNLTIGIYVFQLTATDNMGTSSSAQVQILSTTTLPITYLNFTGQNSGGVNHLTWETTLEDGQFELERSSDGKTFTAIASIPVASEPTHTYFYDDHNPFPGLSYYRIKNISAAGAETYSRVIEVTNGEVKSSVSFYPNPASDYVSVQLQSKERGFTVIRLMDLEGRVLIQQQGVKTDDLYSGKISLNRMAPGLYIVYCTIGDKAHNLGKIVKY